MRKILISVLVVLLIILAYFTIFQGISIGTFNILSVEGIIGTNDELTDRIEEANSKIKSDLQGKKSELSENVKTLLANKESYYRLANISTESEINKANSQETYDIEYLWLRVGSHARSEGVNIKMDVKESNEQDSTLKNLSFTVAGSYIGIIDFVSSLEDDSELSFRIQNFNLLPEENQSSQADENTTVSNLQATFDVTGIRIKLENTTQSVNSIEDQNGQTNENTTDTNAVAENTTVDTNATANTNTAS